MGKKEIAGLKAGVEIHQQLDTGKLFCECPSDLRSENPEIIVKRRLYAVAGETGKVDAAAAYEQSRQRNYVYEGYSGTTCEVEFDESPPTEINKDALRTGLQISLLLNAKPLSVTQVMRKTVVDGSNTSGFQRTVLIARNGYLEIGGKRIGIDSISLEEDSARRVAETKDSVTYRLDRLGIPLIEIATAPDISSEEEIREVVLKIGDILRSTKVKRGIGTIRQDVNVSISGGARTELKGVQDPSLIEKAVEFEINRQLDLVSKKQRVERTVRNVKPDGSNKFLRPMPGAARMYPETDLPLVKISDKFVKEIKANLPKLRSELIEELKKRGVSEEYAGIIVREGKVEEFNELAKTKAPLELIAKVLALYLKDVSNKAGLSLEEINAKLNVDVLSKALSFIKKGELSESMLKQALIESVNGKDLKQYVKESQKAAKSAGPEVELEVKKLLKEKPGLSHSAYMGLLMAKFKGKLEPSEIAKKLKELMK